MFPVIAHVADIKEPLDALGREIGQRNASANFAMADLKLEKMIVLSAHGGFEDRMQGLERCRSADVDATPDRYRKG